MEANDTREDIMDATTGTTAEQIEDAAQTMALYTPLHAIEGWVSGLRANGGPADELAVCERAVEIKDEERGR